MQKNLPTNRLGRWLTGVVLALLATLNAQAQLAGTKTIPGTYTTLAAAIADLNAQGVGAGGVTFNIAAGYTETFASPTAGAITATGTSANPIVFQKSGTGADPVITAGVGTTTTVDAIISLAGSDYVTIDGIDVTESAANTTAMQQMEFGYALFRPSATDGCQFNTIRNCVVTLNKTNTATIGIAGAVGTATSGTAVAATATSGANTSNKVYGNVVTNALTGIYFNASSSTSIANYDQNNEIGVTAGNTIGNFGGSVTAYGAGGNYQNGLKITGNTINSTLNYTSATASTPVAASTVTSTLRGIYTPNGVSSNLDITNNTITLASGATTSQLSGIENGMGSTAAGNTVNITGNTLANSTYATSTSATTYLLYTTSSPATLNITNNTVSANNLGSSVTGSATCYLIYNSGAPTTATISGNVVANNTVAGTASLYLLQAGSATTLTISNNRLTGNSKIGGTTTSGTLYCLAASTAVVTATGNTINNNSVVTTGTTSSTIYGYYDAGSPTAETLTGNTFTNLSISGSTTSTSSSLYGIYSNPLTTTTKSWTQNTVGTLSLSTGGTVYGIYNLTGNTVDISRNKVYDLSAGTSSGVAYGIYLSTGTTVTVANNLVGDLRAAASTNLLGVSGIYVGGVTTANLYFNTVNLAATSSGATFGTSGIYFLTSATIVDVRNNIVVNKSTAVGTGGYTVALRRSAGTASMAPTNLAATSNNNLYYAGTPSATNLIYAEGTTTFTNGQQTLAAYKALVSSREISSATEDVPFLSTTGTATTFLHINPSTPTQVESGGAAISGITTDFDGDPRNATTPDIGADEGTFQLQDLLPPAITYAALTSTANTANRSLVVTITDVSGVATGTNGPRLFYRKGTSGAFVSVLATANTGSSYTFTFNYALVGGIVPGDVIQYYVAAQDVSAGANSGTSPVGGTYTTAPTTPNSFTILAPLSGNYYVGTSAHTPAATYATLTAAAADYNSKGLTGAVNFILIDSDYSTAETFPIAFNANGDASATNVLTIKPETGVSPTIAGSVASGAVLKLNGTDYMTIDGSNNGTTTRNLTITNTSATGAGNAVLWLAAASATDGATFNTVKNTNITGNSAAGNPQFTVFLGGGGAGVAAPTTSTPAANSNNTLSNNVITKGYYGVFVYGVSATVLDQNNTLTGNQIGQSASGTGFGLEGLRAVYQQNLKVQANEIQGVIGAGGASHFGMNLGTLQNALIDRNSVHDVQSTNTTSGYVGYGISLASTALATSTNASANTISNNIIYNISAPLAATSSNPNVLGIANGGGYGDKLYFNTILLNGAQTAGTGYSAGISNGDSQYSTASSALDVRNNIVAITANVTTAAKYFGFYTSAANVTGSTLDYNDYYLAGTGSATFAVGNLNGTSLASSATLAAWQTATGQESHSLSVDPQFLQTTATPFTLTPTNLALNNTGVPISGITTDYTGATRGAVPDIGAIEFTPVAIDLAPVALVAPATTSTCYGTAEAVSVSIRNVGTSTLNFASNPATITVVVTLPGGTTQTLTTTLATGSLANGTNQTVVLPTTLNMSTVGTYSFAITATVTGDQNTSNDALTPAFTRTVLAPVAGTLAPAATSICVSGTATLTLTGAANGSIQFQSSPNNTTFTDIAGATSATYTTPVLTTTTYYRVQVRCNTGVATSNVSTVTVNNPLVANTNTPVSICAGSTATLTATPSAGSSVRFFSAATGGTALATTTAGTYTTPALTASTTYYAEAFSGGVEAVGKSLTNGADGSNTAGGLYFTATGPTTIAAVTVYQTATATAGTATIQLLSGSNTTGTPLQQQVVTLPANTTGALLAIPVTLNFAVPAAGAYTLYLSASTTTLVRDYTTALPATVYPYTSPSGTVSITGATLTGGFYYFFYNWQLGSECVGTARTPIQVNVMQPATASFAATTASTCGSSPYQLAGTVGGSATAGTYTSSGTGTFSPNATTLNATYTPSAADITAGSVTITLTATAAPCAPATATLALSISPAPLATFSYPATGGNCAGSTGTVAPTLGTGATAGTFTSTTGLTINATTGVITLSTSTAGTYTVTNTVAASGACAAATATATITVSPAPVANAGAAAALCSGSTAQLGAATTAGLTYSWSPATGLSSAIIANPTVTLANTTAAPTTVTYTLTVTNTAGCSATSSVVVTVNPVPARPTLTPTYNGTQTTLTSSAATGNQFYFNGVAIPGATGQTYVVNGSATTYGAYTVVVTNSFGCVSQASVATTVTSSKGSIAGASIELYPNPTPDGQVTLVLSGLRSATQLAVLDALGREVSREQLPATTGVVTRSLDLTRLASGVYLLRLSNAEGVETRRLTRE